MSIERSCPDCRAVMRLETRTFGFQTFECPKCALVVIEVVDDNHIFSGGETSWRLGRTKRAVDDERQVRVWQRGSR
jgi:hypothetical protein